MPVAGPHEQVLERCADGATAPRSVPNEIDALLDRVAHLPTAPRILPRLLAALSDTRTDVNEIVDLVTLDTALTARLLRICNSAFFGTSQPVEEVDEAVHRLGFDTVYRAVAVLSGSDCFKIQGVSDADSDALWRHSVATAFAALFVAEDIGLDRGVLFTAGMLHDFGRIILAIASQKSGTVRIATALASDAGVLAWEKASYGFTHAEAGGRMLERWRFSNHLVASVRYHHEPAAAGEAARFAACIAVANALAHGLDAAASQPSSAPETDAALNILGWSAKQMDCYGERISENLRFAEGMCRS